MKKSITLPVFAAFVIALLVIPAMPVNAVTPVSALNIASIVTVPEDDLKRNTGVMVLGLEPTTTVLKANTVWFTDSVCSVGSVLTADRLVGPELTDEPIWWADGRASIVLFKRVSGILCERHEFAPVWNKPIQPGWDLLSQHKVLMTLNGQPTDPTVAPFCEIVEKEKAKIPPQSDKPLGKRQFPDEMIKTTLQDVTPNFWCKFRHIKPGVYALDVYFVGPQIIDFVADHMLIVTAGWKVGTKTIWASELQDICILGWSMGNNALGILLYDEYKLSEGWYRDTYWSWDDALGPFVSCDEAAAWQRAWIVGGWPWSEN